MYFIRIYIGFTGITYLILFKPNELSIRFRKDLIQNGEEWNELERNVKKFNVFVCILGITILVNIGLIIELFITFCIQHRHTRTHTHTHSRKNAQL